MTTQSKLNSSIEDAPAIVVKQYFDWPLALAILILGILVGVVGANLPIINSETGVSGVPERRLRDFPPRPDLIELEKKVIVAAEAQVQRGLEAEATRYTSLAMYYAAGNEANTQRAIEAEAARYSGLARFYTGEHQIRGHRGLEAEAARYGGLAKFYVTKDLAWPPRPTQFQIGEDAAMSPAEIALAEYHRSEWGYTPSANSLAWPPRPTQLYSAEKAIEPIAENALAIYHQSEWGRTFSTVLPLIEAKLEVEVNDVGVQRPNCGPVSPCTSLFSTIVNNVGVQKHDREYGLAAFSTGTAADQDIGLMDFLTAEK